VLPVEIVANSRRAVNAAAGHMPNMDPGTTVVLAGFVAIPIVVALLLVELTRCWVVGHRPLTLPSSAALGALATWPIGLSFSLPWLHLSHQMLLLASAIGVVAFYSARSRWLARHAQRLEERAR
jgi:hypothetical protein